MTNRLACLLLTLALPAGAPLAQTPPKWDVNAPPGPKAEARIDTTSGTWMAVDVSPDGQHIVFDLLGDIYLLPITGGEARALTHSIAWEMQPRFSPDGKRIAFISDAGGGDNVWVMDADGSGARAVTNERERLLGNPVWHPSGDYIAARKHFVGTRSLGSGEIWLYHVAGGGKGVQLNEKPNWQKDLGEPALAPDGRALYWSQDATPGDTFEYHQNSRAEVFRIYRQDLVSGEKTTVAGGAGGAVRPQPSPDGSQLAFVRRKDGQSWLYTKDLRSGRERAVWGPLSRDMQETWSVHGVYPGFAWLPAKGAAREVVIWARGGLHRVDMQTGEARAIAFHVQDTRELRTAVRPAQPTPVEAERFDVKQLRWAQVTPGGERVIYSALGHLYVRDLPEGTPKRLTSQTTHFEYWPRVAPNGKSVVYVSWRDDELGRVRKLDLASGKDTVLTPEPGKYTAPALSPDGKQVAYVKHGGGYLTAPWWGGAPGVYVAPAVPTEGAAPVRVSASGDAPQWGGGSDAIYLTRATGKGEVDTERSLIRVQLADRKETPIARSEAATKFALSPDGRWLGFVERFHTFVTPLPQTARPVSVAPKMEALPVRQLDTDAGQYLHWSGDSQRLHYMLGDTLHSVAVSGSAADVQTRRIGFSQTADRPQGRIALVGARVVTMRGDEVIDGATVLIEGNRIAAVGPGAEVTIPPGTARIDVRGQTIVPGFIDAHWHGAMAEQQMVPQRSWVDYASLAFGVTTLHDPSNRSGDIFTHAEMQRAGLVTAPRIYSTGGILYGAQGDGRAPVESLADALTHLKRQRAAGALSVKSYNYPRRDQRQMVVAAARETGMLVVPEGGSLFHMNMSMLIDGHTTIEHSLPVDTVYGDVKQLWSQVDITHTPTLGVAYGGLAGEDYWYARTDVWRHPILSRYVPAGVLQRRAVRRETAPDEDFNVFAVARTANALREAGVRSAIGAHGQREGLAAHWELWTFVAGGMTPHQALQTATINPARLFGLDHALGSIEPGKLADLVVIDGDVLADIRQSDRISHVMQNGRLYALPGMNEVAPRQVQRPPFYFEGDGAGAAADDEGEAHTRCVGH